MLEVSAHSAEALLAYRQPKSHANGARRRASRWLAHGHVLHARAGGAGGRYCPMIYNFKNMPQTGWASRDLSLSDLCSGAEKNRFQGFFFLVRCFRSTHL